MNRILSPSEHLMWLSYKNSTENITFCAKIRGSFTVEKLSEALVWLQLRHSRLRAKIVTDARNQPHFSSENVGHIPLQVIERQGEEQWYLKMAEELLHPLPWNEEPLIRVLLLYSSDVSNLVITLHHGIADGLSGAYLIRDILQFISEPHSSREILPNLPPVDEIIPELTKKMVSKSFENSMEVESILKKTYQKNNQVNTLETYTIGLFSWTLSPGETTKLVARTREEKTSVHGALCAAFLLAIAAEIKPGNEIVLRCHTPINIRNYLTISVNENLGEYISRPVTTHRLSQKSNLWDLAREVKYKLNQVIQDGTLFDSILQAKTLLSNSDQNGENPDSRDIGGMDIAITNLGKLNIKQQFGTLQLEEFYFMATGPQSLPLLIGVATIEDKMCLICRYQKSILPNAIAHNIKNTAMEQLLANI